jgi:hypothetical protein
MTLKVKRRNIKVPAFTMIDMITGMVIMSIIISLVFYIFSNFNSQVQSYTHSRSDIIALNLLKVELENKMSSAEKVIERPGGFAILDGKSEVNYTLIDQSLHRIIHLNEDIIYDQINTIEISKNQTIPNQEERVSKISIDLSLGAKTLKLYFIKNDSHQEKINHSILNETD